AREQKRPNQDGVILWTASPGGPCGEAKPSISSGDIIVEVNGKPVKNIDDLTKITEELTEGRLRLLRFLLPLTVEMSGC
ncbi:MAG TPA: PDZ domain-containing protein, partial [Armatimonadota bacterium]|nr:PDZ domain-containing protein [Armatimonadota bacterium]